MQLDFDAYAKFSRPGPRYTSYPTALEFGRNFSLSEYENSLLSQNAQTPLSLYFHMPFCKSACYFCGCNVIYTGKTDKMDRYIDYLEREMEILSRFLDTSRKVTQMHFGGGTPTYFSAVQLDLHICNIKKHFVNFADDAEISCEIHRIQPFATTMNAINLARKYGVKSVNIDLIYGLPLQTFDSFKKTLELSLKLDTNRYAIFNYAHVPWVKKSMRKFDESTLPSPKFKLEILKFTHDFLTSNGYKMIGMDHYAKPDDELFLALQNGQLHRNFQGYTTKGGADLIGVGLTSIGEGANFYAQNFKNMDEYERAIDDGKLPFCKGILLGREDLLRKRVIMGLMANFVVDIRAAEIEFGIKFDEHFARELIALEKFSEFVEISPEKISVTPTGTLLIRNIAMCFDEYLLSDDKRFSKTI